MQTHSAQSSVLRRLLKLAVALLGFKVLANILWEYQWYFPADFQSAFLIGREQTFVGLYRIAFYTHILCGPLALLLAGFLLWSGKAGVRPGVLHRWGGRVQLLLVLFALAPSGLVMALQAHAGLFAGVGFASLAISTGCTVIAAAQCARARKFAAHQVWATRCSILLVSPLLLRLASGVGVVTQLESDLMYQLNAWLSWLVPLAVYELARRQRNAVTHLSRFLVRGSARGVA